MNLKMHKMGVLNEKRCKQNIKFITIIVIMVFYAVANGKNIGIFINWNDCNNSVKGYKNALYKKFDTKEEAYNFTS